MGLKRENQNQLKFYNLAKLLAATNNAPWEKVKILFSYCPQISDDKFIIHPHSLDSIIALGTYYLESNYNHTDRIVPYLLNLFKSLVSAKWVGCSNSPDVPYAESFSYCLNVLLSQISIEIKKDIFVYQTNEISNIYFDIANTLINGFSNSDEQEHFYSIKLPIFLGLAQSMMRYHRKDRTYFCYIFPKYKKFVGIFNNIKSYYESPHIDLLSTDCKQADHVDFNCCHTFLRKHDDYPIGSITSILQIVHSLLSEEIFLLFEKRLNELKTDSSLFSPFYYKNYSEILKCAAMMLYRDILYQYSNSSDYTSIKNFVDFVYATTQKYNSIETVHLEWIEMIGFERVTYQKLKIDILTKVTCLEALVCTVKEVYDVEDLCNQVITSIKFKQNNNRILKISTPYTICCLNSLGTLAEKFPSISEICIKALQEFLASPSFSLINLCKNSSLYKGNMHMHNENSVSKTVWFDYCVFKKMQNSAIESLCVCLRTVHQTDENDTAPFLTKFSSLLFMEKGHPQYALIIENVVNCLGHISCSIPDLTLTILQCFEQRLCRHSIESDIAIIHQLGNILICSKNINRFLGALKIFSTLLQEVYGDSNEELEHISNNLFHVLVNVADRLRDEQKIVTAFIRFLELFVQAGFDELKKAELSIDENQNSKIDHANLLHIVAILATKLPYNYQFKKQQDHLFHNFWLYFVLSKKSSLLKVANEPYLKTIAAKLPTLTSESTTDHDLREFFYTSSLNKIKVSPIKHYLLKTQLLTFLNNTSDMTVLVNKLTLPQVVYLHSVCALEITRIESSEKTSIETLFCYLTNTKLQKDKYGMWQCICKVIEEIFRGFLKSLSKMQRNDTRELILENHVLMFLIYFNNIHSQIRHIADKFLSELIVSFPHMLWSRSVLWSMLDIVSVLHYSLIIDSNDNNNTLRVPHTNYYIFVTDTKRGREEIFYDFIARSREIIFEGMKWAPNIINSHLQEYVIKEGHLFQKVDPTCHLRHCAWSLLCSNEKLYNEISGVITSLSIRSRFIGEVAGLIEKSNFSSFDFGNSLADDVWKACNRKKLKNYQVCLQRATAFAVAQPTLHKEIKHVLTSSHVKFFTEETVSTAIHCWYWLCTVNSNFELEFLIEMFESWQYTVNSRIGLFSKEIINATSNTKMTEEIVDSLYAHNIWTKFIVQQILCTKYSSQDKLEMIIYFLHNNLPISVGGADCIMSRSMESLAARFSILSAALTLLQSDVPIPHLEKVVLRQRIYCSCLDFFCCLPRFPCKGGLCLKQSIDILVKFWNILHSDKKHILKSKPNNGYKDNIQFVNKNATASEENQKTLLPSDYVNTYNSFSDDFFKKRILALCLLAEKIELLSTWREPSIESELDKIGNWQSKFISSNKSIYDFVKSAWDISPVLAVYLPIHLRHDDRIVNAISKIILLNPSAVSHIPHAMTYLATAENVQKDCKELVYLLTWVDAKPVEVLKLLSRNFLMNSYTCQYVLKTLLKCNVDILVQYIPQLVQSLRYDKLGYVSKLLFKSACNNQLFCHQLVWNMKTNMYIDENMTVKSPLFNKLDSFLNDIINQLSGPEKMFYRREFEFVDQITEVSYKIPKNLKGEERRNACLKGLKQIRLRPGCYLPSSPDALICEIDYSSGTPLQSKARTPYLVNFLVHRCSYDKVHEIGMQVSEIKFSGSHINVNELIWGPKSWQRTIFKAADDVRQDILALQVIKYLKDVYQEIGLDIYLFPYRVVAVAPGMGVIECIPNAYSRDQLGKQTDVGLYDYFINTFGDEKTVRFQEAQQNFIKSVAAYSLINFLLQIKDRHNGNIMVDDEGHIIHIDFGFMFESSPGGNLGFEPDMKLTEEMLMIMGGRMDAEPFKWFVELCVKAYLVARRHQEQIITLVSLMLDSGFPCFRGQTIKLLRGRFAPNASDREAAEYLITVIKNSCLNFRTVTYDMLQYLQNSIKY